MDILNWIYLVKKKLVKDTVQDPKDLMIFGNNSSYAKRGDKYQSYGMTVDDFKTYIINSLPSQSPFIFSSPAPFNNNASDGTEILQVALIPANTLPTTEFTLEIAGKTKRVAGSGIGTITSKIYIGTTYGIPGASLVATCNSLTTTSEDGSFTRTFNFDGTVLKGTTASVQTPSDYTSSVSTETYFDPTVDNYIMFATTNAVPGLISTISTARILKY